MSLNEQKGYTRGLLVFTLGAVALLFAFVGTSRDGRMSVSMGLMVAPLTVEAAEADPLERAILLAEEEREAPMGRKADVEVPAQLKHYSDEKRFLALQVAEARRLGVSLPHDYPALSEMIRSGELVELDPLDDGFILYGVGLNASEGPFTHYDARKDRSVPLYAGESAMRDGLKEIDERIEELNGEIAELRDELKKTAVSDKSERAALSREIALKKKEAASLKKRKEVVEDFYVTPKAIEKFATEHEKIARLASDFKGEEYDLQDPDARKRMKARMLSHLRPEARDVLVEIARSYQKRFERPLPVTSVIRTLEYQDRLSRVNPNATRIDVPPHATGLAFDIFYHFMTAEEQEHVMNDLARLQDEGRIEALRERRNHFHVFAFADGARPEEALVSKARSQLRSGVAKSSSSATKVKSVEKSASAKTRAAKKRATKRRGR